MNIKVEFLLSLRDVIGKGEEIVKLPSRATIRELLDDLSRHYGQRFMEYIFEENDLKHNLVVMVNGRSIVNLEGLKTQLKNGDTVDIIKL